MGPYAASNTFPTFTLKHHNNGPHYSTLSRRLPIGGSEFEYSVKFNGVLHIISSSGMCAGVVLS